MANKVLILLYWLLLDVIVYSQNVKYNSITHEGTQWLMSTENIDNHAVKFDSLAMINFFMQVESENEGYKIPSSQEIEEFLNMKKIIPAGKAKEECKKYITCNFIETAGILFVSSITGFEPSHPHLCKHCKDWSDEYRRKVGCSVCKDNRWSYCGKKANCPICDGKGYKLVNTEEKVVDIYGILRKKGFNTYSVFLYYNSPTDFGYYKVYSGTSGYKIKHTSNSIKYHGETGLFLKTGNHNIKEEIDKYYVDTRAKDLSLIEEIRKLISENAYESAFQTYNEITLKESLAQIALELKTNFSKYYSTFEQPFDNDQISKIINENKGVFAILAPGNFRITSDSEGNLSVDGRTLGINMTPLTKTLGNNNQFSVNTSAGGSIKIEQTASNNGIEQILVSTEKQVYQTRKGKLYKKVFLGKGMLDQNVTVTFQGDIPKNRYRKVQPQTIHTIANGIKIATINENKLLFEGKFHNRALVVSSRALLLSGGLFVSGLRIYEYSLIP
jgi:hypothetical protein